MVARKKSPAKKKKRRKGHYKTGLHFSPKCKNSPMKYRSGWELVAAKHFDDDPNVDFYEYESLKIPYLANKRTRKYRNYIPDFLVTYKGGKKVLIEVKRQSAVSNLKVVKKTAAAKLWAREHGYEFAMWTNGIILPLKKLQEAKEETCKKQNEK